MQLDKFALFFSTFCCGLRLKYAENVAVSQHLLLLSCTLVNSSVLSPPILSRMHQDSGAARNPKMHFCLSKWQKEQNTYFTTSQDLAYALIIEIQPLKSLYMYYGMFCTCLEE